MQVLPALGSRERTRHVLTRDAHQVVDVRAQRFGLTIPSEGRVLAGRPGAGLVPPPPPPTHPWRRLLVLVLIAKMAEATSRASPVAGNDIDVEAADVLAQTWITGIAVGQGSFAERWRRNEARALPLVFVIGPHDNVKVRLAASREMAPLLTKPLLEARFVHFQPRLVLSRRAEAWGHALRTQIDIPKVHALEHGLSEVIVFDDALLSTDPSREGAP